MDSPLFLYRSLLVDHLQNRNPDKPALVNKKEIIFPAQLYDSSQHLATQLRISGMKEGDRIVIAVAPGEEFLIIIYALLRLRVIVAIIDPEMGNDNYQAKLDQFDPAWAFVDYRLLLLQEHRWLRWLYMKFRKQGVYFPKRKQIQIIATGNRLPLYSKHLSVRQLRQQKKRLTGVRTIPGNAEFLVTYTSGTVNQPKGVLHTYDSLTHSINRITDQLGSPDNQLIATHLPQHMLIGVNAQVPVYLWKPHLSGKQKIEFIKSHGITTIFGPPSDFLGMVNFCERKNRQLPDCLTHILLGSAPVYAAFLLRLKKHAPHCKITAMYGMTENLLTTVIDGEEKISYRCKGDVLGKPVAGVGLKITPDGEIQVKSDQLYKRYLHLNQRKEWHDTGDLGYIDPNGYLILTGRKKDMIIRRNTNIYPALYEPTINKIPGVDAAVLIGQYDDKLQDERVYLFVETSKKITQSSMMNRLKFGIYAIDSMALPDEIVFMKLPRKGRQNKIDRVALRSIVQQYL